MTTITAANRYTEHLRAGYVLSLQLLQGPGAVFNRSHAGAVVESAQFTASTTLGPYLQDMSIAVSCLAGALVEAAVSADTAAGLNAAQRAAIQSLVSEAGNIASADLLTTTGTTGQVVRLSDGDDKGAILMWSTPEGATAETWCWWLWPQAAYL